MLKQLRTFDPFLLCQQIQLMPIGLSSVRRCQDIGCANILCYKAYAKIIVYVLLLFRIYYLEFL